MEGGECDGLEKPEEEEECDSEVICQQPEWIVSDWSGCGGDGKCGLSRETRTALCADKNGMTFNATECDETKLPSLAKDCEEDTVTAVCDPTWDAAQWSKCSAECAGDAGVRTRKVFCAKAKADAEANSTMVEPVDESECDEAMK